MTFPRTRTRTRILLVVASGAIAGALAWGLMGGGRETQPVAFTRRGEELAALLAGRVAMHSNVTGRGPFELEELDEATARRLFVMQDRTFVFDRDSYFRYRPRMDSVVEWAEHPNGQWGRRTNDDGYREDTDAGFAGADLAVLVTGDSHTDGVCDNAESFTNRLEALLAERHPGEVVCALNTGVVGFSFYNYLGVLRRFLESGSPPDIFVVAVYGGNDFIEALRPHHYFRGTFPPPRREGYWDSIEAAKRVSGPGLAQGLNQVLFFKEHPDEIDVALEAALVLSGEIRRLCEAEDIRLVFVFIPPAFEAGWPALERMEERAMAVLDLTDADLHVARSIAERFFAGLADLGVEVLDMGPVFRAGEAGPYYWKRDLHINVAGHAAISRAVDAALTTGAGRLAPLAGRAPPDGPFEEHDEAGRLSASGAWSGGQRDGPWTVFYPNSQPQSEGGWAGGLRSGEWAWFYEDGTPKKTGAYSADQPEGEWREWYRNGAERLVAHWVSGLPDGEWSQWHADGTRASRGTYAGGEKEGVWLRWYAGERPEFSATYRAGVLEGPAVKHRESGRKAWKGTFRAGARGGEWTFYWPSGARRSAGRYEEGEREGLWSFWNEEGVEDAAQSGTYRGGRRRGT